MALTPRSGQGMPQGLCHRDDGARATTPPSTDLRHISIAWANLNSYRCSHWWSKELASQASWQYLPNSLFGRTGSENKGLDALVVKIKEQNRVINKSIFLAIGVNRCGLKEVICRWGAETEEAKFWLSVITQLKNRGVKDIFISCLDGLKGFPQHKQ